jgi:hypothetical protein
MLNPALSKEEQDALVDAPDLKQWHWGDHRGREAIAALVDPRVASSAANCLAKATSPGSRSA